MKQTLLLLPCLLAAPALAQTCNVPEGEGRPINHANLFIEDNAGDGDLGVHGYFDDEGWSELCVFDPDGKLIMHSVPSGRLGDLTVAGIFWESREPTYKEWDFDALKKDWPEGQYKVRALGYDGELIGGEARFTTIVPLPPEIVTPATVPEPDQGPLPKVPVADLEVAWKPVTQSRDGRAVNVIGYQVTVEKHNYEDPNGFSRPTFDMHLGADRTSIVVPAKLFDPASQYELEVLAIEESGNQTIGGASFFATE